MKRTYAATGGLTRSARPGGGRAAPLLATASLLALLCQVPSAVALDCAGAADAPPSDIATPAALYETLRDRTDAQLLAIGFRQKPVAAECAWIYEVKMLTASGSVVELDFAAQDLDLIGARGPDNDRDVAKLVHGLGGDASTIITGAAKGDGGGSGVSGGGDDNGEGGDDGGGGNSGSGSGDSGSGEGGNSGSGGGDDGGGSEGSEGGNSGSGGGDDGGEGGDD